VDEREGGAGRWCGRLEGSAAGSHDRRPHVEEERTVRDDEGGPDAGTGGGSAEPEPGARTPVTQQVGRIALVVVAGLFVVFALANAQHVDFSWVLGESEVVQQGGERVRGGVRLIILLLAAFLAGAFVAGVAAWQRARHRHHDEER
jgi:uncharacterized integral membrane protein